MNKNETQRSFYSLWKSWREDGDLSAEAQLAEAYLPMVGRVVQRMMKKLPAIVDQNDLLSWGQFGLLDALYKFDYERGLKFETYAIQRIRGSIIDGLRQDDWAPRSVRDKGKKLEEAYRSLEQSFLRPPTLEETAEYLGISVVELRKQQTDVSFSFLTSLDDTVAGEGDKQTVIDRVVDDSSPSQEQVVEEEERKRELARMLDCLSDKEKLVVTLIYYEELTVTEVAEVLELTPGRISQLHSKAISRLRGQMKEKGL
jgi:RNA polymerase sigma factor for flagellar operon FliA